MPFATPGAGAREAGETGGTSRSWWSSVERIVSLLTATATLIVVAFTWVSIRQVGSDQAITREGQITDRYNSAVENLGSSSQDVRLGGIYALQRIMQDSPRDQPTIVNVLSTYIRGHGPSPKIYIGKLRSINEIHDILDTPNAKPPANDVQAALTVLGERNVKHEPKGFAIDLHAATLSGADLRNADLRDANLAGSDLTGADLAGAELDGADLTAATLANAYPRGAHLGKANLNGAILIDTNLGDADLRGADLIGAELFGAILIHANLLGVQLRGADLRSVTLEGARLRGVDLSGADLRGADLRWADAADLRASLVDWRKADLGRANLRGALMTGANMSGADLKLTDLRGTDLRDGYGAVTKVDVAMLLQARLDRTTKLPPRLADDPRIRKAIEAVG